MAFCGECGTKFGQADKFCPECGASSGESPQGVVAAVSNPVFNAPRAYAAKPVVIVGVIIAVLVAIFLIVRSSGTGLGFVDEPAAAAERFITAQQQEKYSEALDDLDPDLRAQISAMGPQKRDMALRQSFRKMTRQYCGDSEISSFDSRTVENTGDRGKVVTTFHCSNGSSSNDEKEPSLVRRAGGKWYLTQ